MKKDLGCLASHRAYLGKPPKRGGTAPFPCRPADVFAKQVSGLVARLRFLRCRDVVVGLSGGLDLTFRLVRRNEILNLNSVNARSHEGA